MSAGGIKAIVILTIAVAAAVTTWSYRRARKKKLEALILEFGLVKDGNLYLGVIDNCKVELEYMSSEVSKSAFDGAFGSAKAHAMIKATFSPFFPVKGLTVQGIRVKGPVGSTRFTTGDDIFDESFSCYIKEETAEITDFLMDSIVRQTMVNCQSSRFTVKYLNGRITVFNASLESMNSDPRGLIEYVFSVGLTLARASTKQP